MKKIFAWVLLLPVLPLALISWLLVLLAIVLQMAEARTLRFEGVGILTTDWRPWVAKIYPYSVTLGRSMIFYPKSRSASDGMEDTMELHEMTHIAQMEDTMLSSFILGLVLALTTGNVLLGFLVWCSGSIWRATSWGTALLRYAHTVSWPKEGSFWSKLKTFVGKLTDIAYRDSEHERSAYAQTDLYLDDSALGGVTSWAAERDKRRSAS